MKKKKITFDILDIYEIFVIENPFLGRRNAKDMRNFIKLYAYELFHKPIEKITDKQIKSCIRSVHLIGKKRESLKLTAYLNILLKFAKQKSIIKNNLVSKIFKEILKDQS